MRRRGPGRGGGGALDRIYTRLRDHLQRTRTRRRPRAGRLTKPRSRQRRHPHHDGRRLVRGVGRGGAVDFLRRVGYVIAREPFMVEMSWSCATIVERCSSRSCGGSSSSARTLVKRCVTLGQLAPAPLNKYDHVSMDIEEGLFRAAPAVDEGLVHGRPRPNFCGAARGRWECFFLPWNGGGTHGKVTAAAGSTSARSEAAGGARRRFLEGLS